MRQQKEAPNWPAKNSPFLQIGQKVFALQEPLGCDPVSHCQGCCPLHRTCGKPSSEPGVQPSTFHLCLGSIFVLLVGLPTPGSFGVLVTKAQPELTTAQCAQDLVSVPLALGSPFTLNPLPVSHHGFWLGLCPIFRQKLAKKMDWEVASASTKHLFYTALLQAQGGPRWGEAHDDRGPSQGAQACSDSNAAGRCGRTPDPDPQCRHPQDSRGCTASGTTGSGKADQLFLRQVPASRRPAHAC